MRASLILCDNYLVRDVLLGGVWLIIAVHVAMSLDRVVAAMPSVFLWEISYDYCVPVNRFIVNCQRIRVQIHIRAFLGLNFPLLTIIRNRVFEHHLLMRVLDGCSLVFRSAWLKWRVSLNRASSSIGSVWSEKFVVGRFTAHVKCLHRQLFAGSISLVLNAGSRSWWSNRD